MCVIVVTMRGWAGVGLWVAVCFLAKISLHRPTCKTTFARFKWHSHRQSRSHFVFSSLSDQVTAKQREIRLFFIFRNFFLYKITVSFTMVIKRSPCGAWSAGGGRSTSKSTCVVPTWNLATFGDRSASSMSKYRARRELWPRKWFLLGRNPWH